jgi:hypothetical protein
MKKVIVALLVSIFGFSNVFTGVVDAESLNPCGNWEDVEPGANGFEDMVEVCELNWIKGGGGKLYLKKNLKRIELVAVVNRVLGVNKYTVDGEDAHKTLSETYSDMGEYDENKDWMYLALDKGVAQKANFNQSFWSGYPDGSFKMMKDISYAEFLKLLLFSFEKMEQLNGNFRVLDYSGGDWYSSYFNFLDYYKVLEIQEGGDSFLFEDDQYSVHDAVSREMAIRLISRILDRDVYSVGKTYEFEGVSLEVPYYMKEVSQSNESLKIWKDEEGDSKLKVVKVLKSSEAVMPKDFISVYVPTRLSGRVTKMYRVDKCSDIECLRGFWLVLVNGDILILEGAFAKEKTASGEKAVDLIVNSIDF